MVVDHPTSEAQLAARFGEQAACLAYLERLRWPDGFVCPGCGSTDAWRANAGRWACAGCSRKVSPTAGTVFHGTRVPLPAWFDVAWRFAEREYGINARTVHDRLGLGSYQTAWTMLHRLRRALAGEPPIQLTGQVEVDTVSADRLGRLHRGSGGGAVVAIAVQTSAGDRTGPVRLRHLPRRTGEVLRGFMAENIDERAVVLVGGHTDEPADQMLDGPRLPVRTTDHPDPTTATVTDLADRLSRWLYATHRGIHPDHLQAYLDEFAFRANHRRGDEPGQAFRQLMQLAVRTEPATYQDIAGDR